MNLLILSDLTPPVKIGKKLEDLFMFSDYILFNLEGTLIKIKIALSLNG